MDLENIHNFNNFGSHASSFVQGDKHSRTASRMLSTSGTISKRNPELNSASRTDRSRTVEGNLAHAQLLKKATSVSNSRTNSKNSWSDRSQSVILDTFGNPVDKDVIQRGCCGNLGAIFGGFRYED